VRFGFACAIRFIMRRLSVNACLTVRLAAILAFVRVAGSVAAAYWPARAPPGPRGSRAQPSWSAFGRPSFPAGLHRERRFPWTFVGQSGYRGWPVPAP
jgi:hypothetical protein